MTRHVDALGAEVRGLEDSESLRASPPGLPVVVRVDGASFSRFTRGFGRPFDARIAEAMDAACKALVQDFNCLVGYTQSDEISVLCWSPEGELPFGGRFQKLASRFAAKATSSFLVKALELFPEAVERQVPEFDGRATAFPSIDAAARAFLWREIDARKNAVSMAARSMFSARSIHGKSSSQMKEMLAAEGIDFRAYPERFRRGAFFRRVTVERFLSPAELARIPEANRPQGPVKRSHVAPVSLPPLSQVVNLAEVLAYGAAPLAPTIPPDTAAGLHRTEP